MLPELRGVLLLSSFSRPAMTPIRASDRSLCPLAAFSIFVYNAS